MKMEGLLRLGTTKVTTNGRVGLSQDTMDRLGVGVGDFVDFWLDGDKIIVMGSKKAPRKSE